MALPLAAVRDGAIDHKSSSYSNPTGVVKPILWLPLPNVAPLEHGATGFTTGVGLL